MSYRTAAVRDSMVRGSIVQWLFLFLLALIAADSAAAQDLAFTPGQYGIYAGNTVSPSKSGPSLSPPGYTGTAADLVMGGPGGLVFDSVGNLYIMDQGNAILRVVAASSTPIPTLPGVAVQAGHVYTVAGTTNGYGSTIPCDGGTDLQGDGCPATLGAIKYVYGIAVDKNGNVYIADYATNQIRAVYGGTGGLPGITNPQAGYIYALTNAIDSTTASTESGDNGPDTAAIDPDPYYVAVDSYGNIYFTDGRDTNVRFIYNSGNLPANFFPTGVTPTQGYIYLLTAGTGTCPNPKVKMVGTRTIKLAGACDGSPVGEAYFQTDAMAIAIDSSNNIYLQDKSSEEIQAVYVSGNLPGLDSSTLTVGNLYDVAGTSAEGVPVLNGPALQSPLYISGQASGGFEGLYVDKAGTLYFNGSISSASGEDRIFKVDPSGILTIVYGGTTLCTVTPINNSSEPPVDQQILGCGSTSVPDLSDNGMTIDANGNLYISNEVNLGSNIIEESNVGTSAVAYTGTIGIATPNQTVTISNTGAQALQLSDLSFTGPYSQVSTGATDCSSTTSLAVGASCQIGVSFLPTTPGTETGTLVVTSNALNAQGGTNTANLSGIAAQATSITALTASPGGVVVANIGQTVTFTATVAPQIGDTLTPTGSITFMDGSATVGTSNLNGTTATLNATTLAAGTHTLTAVYSGDVNFITSTSAPFQVTVSSSPVAVVSIASSAASVNSGQSVTFTANVAVFSGSGTPAGTVSFQDGANPLPNSTVTLSGSTATYTTTALPAGNNQVIAVYNGNSSFGANDSTPVSVQVNAAGVLQFSPGIISLVSGSYFTASGAPASGSAANAAQYSPGSVAVDSYGNTYTVGPSTSSIYEATAVYVTASGKGPIPGISNPTAGDIYLLGASTACATATTSACGDGGPIASAFFNAPGALAVDALNNLYVVDDEEIRKVSAITGIVTNLGGTYGKAGYTGDNGLATAATLTVSTLFVDASGNIYIADNRDALIRRIDGLTGVISHIAGLPPVNTYTPTLCAALPCGAGGLAVNAGLIGPKGIFVDQSGNVYFGDSGYDLGGNINIIRRIDGQTGIISLYAGQYFPPGLTYPGPCDPQSGVSCGDGGPATSALMNNITDITGDETGNIYIADSSLATIRQINAKTGIINTIVGNATTEGSGTATNICSAAPCGDGSAANVAELKSPQSVAVDPQGNIYIADSGTYTVREVTGSTTTLAFGSQTLGSLTGQAVSLTNLGNQPVDISGVTVPSSFPQQASGGSDCTSTTTLAAGDQCELDLAFFPTVTGVVSQTATIASNSTNATSGVNSITLTGTGVSAGGTQAQTITFTPPAGPFYAGQQVPLTATADSGLQVEYLVSSGSAIVENNGTASAELKINGPGKIIVTAYQFGNEQYAPANPVQVSLTAATPVLTFTATVPSIAVGAPLPVYTSAADYTVTGLIGNDTASAITGQPTITVLDANGNVIAPGTVLDAGVYQVAIAQGTLSFPSYYQPAFVNGTLSVTGVNQQTISFTGLPANIPYAGAATHTLNAVADDAITGKPDGQPITYSVTGPATVSGSTLTITGAGTVVVTATQSGSTYYNAASATETIQVSKATLTVTAVSLTYAQGVPLPALTSSSSYTITGFAQGDNLSSVSGQPRARGD